MHHIGGIWQGFFGGQDNLCHLGEPGQEGIAVALCLVLHVYAQVLVRPSSSSTTRASSLVITTSYTLPSLPGAQTALKFSKMLNLYTLKCHYSRCGRFWYFKPSAFKSLSKTDGKRHAYHADLRYFTHLTGETP